MPTCTCSDCKLQFKSIHAYRRHRTRDRKCVPLLDLLARGMTKDARGRLGTPRPLPRELFESGATAARLARMASRMA